MNPQSSARQNDPHEQDLNHLLRTLGSVQPDQAFIERTLRAVETRQTSPSPRANLWPGLAFAATCAIALAISVTLFPHYGRPGYDPPTAAFAIHSISVPLNAAQRVPSQSSPVAGSKPAKAPQFVTASTQAQEQDPAYAPSMLAPPLPLTEQERLLIRATRREGLTELAMLNPDELTKREAADDAQFNQFFPPPAKLPDDHQATNPTTATPNRNRSRRRQMNRILSNPFAALACVLALAPAHAQTSTPEAKPAQTPDAPHHDSREPDGPQILQTFFLNATTTPNDDNEILTAIRLMASPRFVVYVTPIDHSITVRGSAEDVSLTKQLLADLDRPKRSYRLTYTLTESDQGKRIGVQHVSTVLVTGGRTTLKQGSKIPVATGSFDEGKNGSQTQFTYLDVGLNFDATLDVFANGMRLKSKVEQSSLADDKVISGINEPVVRQTVLEGTSIIIPGKSLVLGTVDVPGSTRHLEIEALLEPAS